MLVVLGSCKLREVVQIAERVRAEWARKRLKVGGSEFPLTLSIGCTSSECFGEPTPDELIQASDRALDRAKQSGRNLVAVSHELHAPVEGKEDERPDAG